MKPVRVPGNGGKAVFSLRGIDVPNVLNDHLLRGARQTFGMARRLELQRLPGHLVVHAVACSISSGYTLQYIVSVNILEGKKMKNGVKGLMGFVSIFS